MSTFPFHAIREDRRYTRDIDEAHLNLLRTRTAQQSLISQREFFSAQLKQSTAIIRSVESLGDTLSQTGSIPLAQEVLEVFSQGFSELNDVLTNTNQAVSTLSQMIEGRLQRLSDQFAQQHRAVLEILRYPRRNEAVELSKEAERLLKLGGELEGRDREDQFKEAMKVLQEITKNPIGNLDYITWFHIGFVTWKTENKIAAAENAFHRARFLSLGTKNVWHVTAIRHLAEMRHLQGRHQEAYATIQEAIVLGPDYKLLFDSARYAARAGHREEWTKLLGECLELEPLTWTMLGDSDFQTTDPDKEALRQFARQRLQEKRLAAEKSLNHLRHLIADIEQLELKADLTVQIKLSLIKDLSRFEGELMNADYLQSLAVAASAQATVQQTETSVNDIVTANLQQIHSALTTIEKQLNDAGQKTVQSLIQAKSEVEEYRNTLRCSADRADLPEPPALLKQACWGFVVGFAYAWIVGVIALFVINIPLDQFERPMSGFWYKFVFISQRGMLYGGWLIVPAVAWLRWHFKCNDLKHDAEKKAKQLLCSAETALPGKLHTINAAGTTLLVDLTTALSAYRLRKTKTAEALKAFNSRSDVRKAQSAS